MGPAYALPLQSVVIDQPRPSSDALLRIEGMMASKVFAHGYVTIEHGGATDVLLIYGGAVHSAARLDGDRVEAIEVVEFFRRVREERAGRTRFCRTEPGLLLLAAVAFQNNPVLQASASVADIERVLADVSARRSAAVVELLRGRDRTLAYCRGGEPVAVFFGNRADAPAAETVREQLIAYGRQAPAETRVKLYADLQSRRDQHAERSFEDLLAGRVGPPPFMLTVMHGTERVQRRLLNQVRARVGRDPANDIPIDHRSVSRQHCTFEWRNGGFWVADAGSVNGTRVNGELVTEGRRLVHGDRITAGEFDILFGSGAEASSEQELHTVFLEPDPAERGRAQLLRDGEPTSIDAAVFKIGRSPDADLRLRGLLIKPIQATIVRESAGVYRLLAVAGGRSVRAGGQTVPAGGVLLESGAVIRIGGHELIFVLTE